MASITSEAQCQ